MREKNFARGKRDEEEEEEENVFDKKSRQNMKNFDDEIQKLDCGESKI